MILYKYFKEAWQRDLWLENKGKIYFSPIEKFTKKTCEPSRMDELENTILFSGVQKIQINGKEFLAENIKISDDAIGNFISCFSEDLKEELRMKFGNFILRFDADDFLNFLDSAKFDGISFKHGKINYLSEQISTTSNVFSKRKDFEEESEYRILMKIPDKDKIRKLEINDKDHFPIEFLKPSIKKYFSII
jgi:hypothetical protein